MSQFFITEEKLKANSLINENVDDKLIKPLLTTCQDIYIHPIIGTGLYNELKTQIAASGVTALNQTLLEDYIQPTLIWYIMSEAPIAMTYQFRNKGVMKRNSENSNSADIDELISISNKYKYNAEFYAKRLSDYLCANSMDYPLYINAGNAADTLHPNNQVYQSGMFLDNDNIGLSSLEYNRKYKSGSIYPHTDNYTNLNI